MFGNGKSAFTSLSGELRLRPSASPFLGQGAPGAQAPSSPVPGPVSATPMTAPPAPAPAPAPDTTSGIPHQTQVLVAAGLAGVALLGTILFSD